MSIFGNALFFASLIKREKLLLNLILFILLFELINSQSITQSIGSISPSGRIKGFKKIF